MEKVYIYGGGQTGKAIYKKIKDKYDVIGFLDGNSDKWGNTIYDKPILGGIDFLHNKEYDYVFIGSFLWQDIKNHLLEYGVKEERIKLELPQNVLSEARVSFLRSYSSMFISENVKLRGKCTEVTSIGD